MEANSSSLMNTMMIRALDKIATEIKKLDRGCFKRVRTKDGHHGRITNRFRKDLLFDFCRLVNLMKASILRKKWVNVKISY